MRLEIIRGDALKRGVWRFYLVLNYTKSEIRLTNYYIEKKKTSRHKWRQEAWWEQGAQQYSPIKSPPLPVDVAAEAQSAFGEMVAQLPVVLDIKG